MWLVYDQAGREFVSSLYQNLDGAHIAAALQQAQIRFINGKGRIEIDIPTEHPFYWASFCLYERIPCY
jgi:CHAT domain-containing protein